MHDADFHRWSGRLQSCGKNRLPPYTFSQIMNTHDWDVFIDFIHIPTLNLWFTKIMFPPQKKGLTLW